MKLSSIEIQRIYESTKWINDKGSITDPAFISAFDKISYLNDRKVGCYSLCAVTSRDLRSERIKDLSVEAMEFIERRQKEGYKHTYHSLMAVLDNYRKKIDSVEAFNEQKAEIKDNYIQKYKINEADMIYFNEIFDFAFRNTANKFV